jgi:hypothetical protein
VLTADVDEVPGEVIQDDGRERRPPAR